MSDATGLPGHLVKGRLAERRAREHLELRGMALVEANYRCPPGEIDLVMKQGPVLVFVEVRYRADESYGGALESIDARKRRKLRAAAAHYLQTRYATMEVDCRFDVVLVSGMSAAGTAADEVQVDWIPNAL